MSNNSIADLSNPFLSCCAHLYRFKWTISMGCFCIIEAPHPPPPTSQLSIFTNSSMSLDPSNLDKSHAMRIKPQEDKGRQKIDLPGRQKSRLKD